MCQTKGDQPETTMLCIRSWVGALSGWAAAVFTAYKTLVPLIKQMRFQADAALIKSIEAEIVELRKFIDFDRSLEGDLDQEDIMMILMFYAKIDFRKEFQAQSDQISLAQTQIEIYITGILDKFVDCQQCISIFAPRY